MHHDQELAVMGCEMCTFNDALNNCPNQYHLCSLNELYLGGFEIARRNGWFRTSGDIWIRPEEGPAPLDGEERRKLAVCCQNTNSAER